MRNRMNLAVFLAVAVVVTVIALVVMPSGRFSWITLADAYGSGAPAKPGVVQAGGNAVIQTKSDGSLNIISLGANGLSTVVLDISASQLAKLPDKPGKNTKIGATSDNYVQVFKLTTGEYQANIGPDAEGKIFVYVFSIVPEDCISRYEYSTSDPTPRFRQAC
ncbi:MAG: hypothetical protein H0X30_18585 [Anaerolineae bacterium]|nr:hypothetical protein [Anaerolineae bacterium]